MAYLYHVSLQDSEKELADWIREKQSKKEISLSLVFYNALKELKRQDDINHSENPTLLHQRIDSLKGTIGLLQQCMQENNMQEVWFKFFETHNPDNKPKEIIEEIKNGN